MKKIAKARRRILKKTSKHVVITPSTFLKCVGVHKLQTHMECRRKYFWQWVLNIIPSKLNTSFWFGSVMHKGAEVSVGSRKINTIIDAMRKESKIASQGYKIDAFTQDEMDLMLEMSYIIMRVYLDLFDDEIETGNIIETERYFQIPLKETPVMLHGTLDAYSKIGNSYYLVEYKTASQITNEYFSRLKFDKQINTYALGVKSITGKLPAGCPYIVFRKPAIRVKKTETTTEFLKRLEEDLYSRPDFYFLRHDVRFGHKSVDAVLQDIEWETFDLYTKYTYLSQKQLMNPFNWPRNDRACFNYGVCPYFMLCKKVTSYKLYLQFYRMREIRYEIEKSELCKSQSFATTGNCKIKM